MFNAASCSGETLEDIVRDSINLGQQLYVQVTDVTGSHTYPKQLISTTPLSVYAQKVAPSSINHLSLQGIAANCTNGQMFISNGSGGFSCSNVATYASPTGAASGDLTGNYPSPSIADDAVVTAKILDGNVTAAKLSSNAVTTVKIQDGAVTAAKLNQMGASNNQVLKWNNTTLTWAPAADSGITTELDPEFADYKAAISSCNNWEYLQWDALLNSGAGGYFCKNRTEMRAVNNIVITADSDDDNNGDIIFNTGTTEKIRFTNNGRIGIGTDTPNAHVHIKNNDDNARIFIENVESNTDQ